MQHSPARILGALACLLVLPAFGADPAESLEACALEVTFQGTEPAQVDDNTSGTIYTFFAKNNGSTPAYVSISCSATGNITCTSVDTPGPVWLGQPTYPLSVDVGANYTAGSIGTGTIRVNATASGCASAKRIISVNVG